MNISVKTGLRHLTEECLILTQNLISMLFVHCDVVWASIMPKYGMDRIQYAYKNIEYPKRLVSSLMQRDFKAAKAETARFLANSTIGLGGMFDPAKSIFNIEPMEEDIEQGLSKCKVKRGPFLILPILSATTPRALLGRAIETGLRPDNLCCSACCSPG